MSTTTALRSLNINNINPHVKEAKYAVRGELAIKSEEYRAQLRKQNQTNGVSKDSAPPLPFDKVISANIGNPQQLDQKPITFFRQVLSLLENPHLLDNESALKSSFNYPQDVIDRAKWLHSEAHSIGAYSASQGIPAVRESVANFISNRDGYPASPSDIYLTAGASSGVNTLMHIICATPKTGVLVPIPQYPLYTATLSVLNATYVPYYLDESKHWGTDINTIKESYEKAVSSGIDVRAIVIINPGNPTGASLSPADIHSIIDFAATNRLVVVADEVYQTNIFPNQQPFTSFKRALRDLQSQQPSGSTKYSTVELASLHSCSKGMVGECGHRAGYFELVNFDPEVQAQIYKFISIMLCPPVIGQCLVELMVNPPSPQSPSYALYQSEYNAIKNGLHERATALYHAFKDLEGVSVQEPMGSMYLFPTIRLPEKAVKKAEELGKKPDEYYCLRLLERTGICVVPGSGFGQKEGTLHFRTTFLAPGTEWVGSFGEFHGEFMDEFR
ncbi:MAG: hypothetical protein Q9227_002083 [Pyrenula ochraceoflavens]